MSAGLGSAGRWIGAHKYCSAFSPFGWSRMPIPISRSPLMAFLEKTTLGTPIFPPFLLSKGNLRAEVRGPKVPESLIRLSAISGIYFHFLRSPSVNNGVSSCQGGGKTGFFGRAAAQKGYFRQGSFPPPIPTRRGSLPLNSCSFEVLIFQTTDF